MPYFVAGALALLAIAVSSYALWLLRQVLTELRSMNVRLAEALELARRIGAIEERMLHAEERIGKVGHDLNSGFTRLRGEIQGLSDEIVSVGIRESSG
jgi:type II secretory pathway component PulJ